MHSASWPQPFASIPVSSSSSPRAVPWRVPTPPDAPPTSLTGSSRIQEASFLDCLRRGDVVDISRPDECAILAVPASLGGQVVCALVLASSRSPRRWAPALVERLQLLSEILGAALQRAATRGALRANVAVIEQLNARLEADNVYLKEEIKNYHDFDDIVGESPALRLALSRLSQVAPTNSSVLLLGPTGTGKELFARALHERSRRHARPLVRVNCAALPPTLVESELFGHEKGAFTGAVATAAGPLRAGRRRHHLPRRDRRSAAGHPGEVSARAAGRGVRARRLLAHARRSTCA